MRFSLSSTNEAAVCVGMVRGLQMGIQSRKREGSTTVARVEAWEQGEEGVPFEERESEGGL